MNFLELHSLVEVEEDIYIDDPSLFSEVSLPSEFFEHQRCLRIITKTKRFSILYFKSGWTKVNLPCPFTLTCLASLIRT